MTAMDKVVLRYFPIVGRAQALRHGLADAGVSFEDVTSSLADWPNQKDDASFGGAFAALPTLTWGKDHVSETLPIATFLAKRLGHYEGLDDAAIARHEALCSCAYTDGMSPMGQVIWSDMMFVGVDLVATFPRVLGRSLSKLARLDAVSPTSGWFGRDRPTLADFFVVEALHVHLHVLGTAHEGALRARFPRLAALMDRTFERPAIRRLQRPQRFTARPDESAVIERLRGADLSALGI
jgi:glutathione S-transferase